MVYSEMVAGRQYQVRFRAQSRPGYPRRSFIVAVNGQTLASFQPIGSFQNYTSPTFTATGTSGAVTFATIDVGHDCASGINDVEIVAM